jgi:hypothetical protein
LAALSELLRDASETGEGRPAGAARRSGICGLLFLLGLALCLGASMVNLFLIPTLAAYACLSWVRPHESARAAIRGRGGEFMRRHRFLLASSISIAGAFSVYYFLTVIRGYGGLREPFRWLNAAVIGYDWLGFRPLGIPRNMIREAQLSQALSAYLWPLLLGVIAWLAVFLLAFRRRAELARQPVVRQLGLSLFAGVLPLVIVAMVTPALLWGRHFMLAYPFFLLLLGQVLAPGQAERCQGSARLVLVLLIGLFLFADLRQRFMPVYEKEPYRAAVAEVSRLHCDLPELPIVWLAYDRAVALYGGPEWRLIATVPPASRPHGANAPILWVNGTPWTERAIRNWKAAVPEYMVLLHRPDILDLRHLWYQAAGPGQTKLLWQRSGMRIFYVTHNLGP